MQEDFGRLAVRVGAGGLLLFHGIHKLLTGIEPIGAMLTAHQMPELIAYGVYFGEIVGPVLVILGFYARIGGLLIVLDMVLAILLARMDALFALTAQGGYALELESFYLLSGVAVVLLGAGRFALGASGRWN